MGDRPSSLVRNRQQTALPQEQLFDTHAEVSLDFEIVRQAARQKYTRPFLIIDTAIVREKLRRFRAAMPRVRPHYAVKANPDRRVLKALVQEGAGFEIASTSELDLLLSLGVPSAEVFFSNPMRSRDADGYAVAMISRVSPAPAPNLPDNGQSEPMFGVAMRRYRHAPGSTPCMRRSSSTLSTTNQRTPLDAA